MVRVLEIVRDSDPAPGEIIRDMTTQTPQNLVPVADAAEIAGYTTRSIWHWLETGKLTRYRAGSRTLIDADELVEMLAPRVA